VDRTPAFWDTSALVPICIYHATTLQARTLLRKYAPVAWWGSFVEVHSAIARLHREKQINDDMRQNALMRLTLLTRSWNEILPSEDLRQLAGNLLHRYPLRAADSMQLAAALTWCQQKPAQKIFLCDDKKLSEAATLSGFTVIQFPATT
jgi:uncharacterized protein